MSTSDSRGRGCALGRVLTLALVAGSAVVPHATAGEALYTCDDDARHAFPKSALGNPKGAERGDHPADRTLAESIVRLRREGFDELPARGWRRLFTSDEAAVYGHDARPGRFDWSVTLLRDGAEWVLGPFGGCGPTRVVPGYETAPFSLVRDAWPRPGDRKITIEYETGTCHPGRRHHPDRFDHVRVHANRRAVAILVVLRPEPAEEAACAGVGLLVRRRIELPGRIRRRVVRDALFTPPRRVARVR